jgi:hypothetical protein
MRIKARKVSYWRIIVDCGDGRTITPVLVTRDKLRRLNSLRLNDKYFLSDNHGSGGFWVMRIPDGLLKIPWMSSDYEIQRLEALL